MVGKVLTIAISEKKGVLKEPVDEVVIIEDYGIKGDAHAGPGTRQVSVLPMEALSKVPEEKKEEVMEGHTENIVIEGIPLERLKIGARIRVGEAILEIVHIGKDEFKDHGRAYIVSREGRFCRVIKGGRVRVGDKVELIQ